MFNVYLPSFCFVYISSIQREEEESKTGMAEGCDKESDDTDNRTM